MPPVQEPLELPQHTPDEQPAYQYNDPDTDPWDWSKLGALFDGLSIGNLWPSGI